MLKIIQWLRDKLQILAFNHNTPLPPFTIPLQVFKWFLKSSLWRSMEPILRVCPRVEWPYLSGLPRPPSPSHSGQAGVRWNHCPSTEGGRSEWDPCHSPEGSVTSPVPSNGELLRLCEPRIAFAAQVVGSPCLTVPSLQALFKIFWFWLYPALQEMMNSSMVGTAASFNSVHKNLALSKQ